MAERTSYSRFTVTLTGILLIFLGATILAHPGNVTTFLVRLAGFACAVFGGMALAGYLLRAHDIDLIPFEDIVWAGIMLFAGAIVGLFPSFFAKAFFSVLGIFIVISGLSDIAHSRSMAAIDDQKERVALRVGIITVAVGIFVTVMPIAAVNAVPILCGIALVLDGFSELFIALQMSAS